MRRAALLGMGLLASCGSRPSPYDAVKPIIDRHCTSCHSAAPTRSDYTQPPLGVVLETPEQVKNHAVRIKALAVTTQTMPLGNTTGMTETERRQLGKWIDAGAPIE